MASRELFFIQNHKLDQEKIRRRPKVGSYDEFKRVIGNKRWYLLENPPAIFSPGEELWENLYIPFIVGNPAEVEQGKVKLKEIVNVRVASILAENGFTEP